MEQFKDWKAWGDISRRDQLEATWWDLYKDVHGVRPRGIDTTGWTEADFEKELDFLSGTLALVDKQRQEEEQLAIDQLEYRIQSLVHHGARNRAMALRWIHEAYETTGEWDRLEWNLGVPYGYFASKGDVV